VLTSLARATIEAQCVFPPTRRKKSARELVNNYLHCQVEGCGGADGSGGIKLIVWVVVTNPFFFPGLCPWQPGSRQNKTLEPTEQPRRFARGQKNMIFPFPKKTWEISPWRIILRRSGTKKTSERSLTLAPGRSGEKSLACFFLYQIYVEIYVRGRSPGVF
jgi:hypothetical protein